MANLNDFSKMQEAVSRASRLEEVAMRASQLQETANRIASLSIPQPETISALTMPKIRDYSADAHVKVNHF